MSRLLLILFVSISLAGPASALIFSNGKVVIIPPNAYESGTTWLCHSGYKKSGDKCIKKTTTPKIPLNAHKIGSGWVCNTDFYLNSYRDDCIKVPPNAYSTNLSNYFLCKTGYERSGSRCIKKTIEDITNEIDQLREKQRLDDYKLEEMFSSLEDKQTTSSDDYSEEWILIFLAFLAFLIFKPNSDKKTGTYRVTNHETVAQRAAKKKAAAAMSVKKKEWQKQTDERYRKRAEKEKRKILKTMPKEEAEAERAAMKKAASERAAKKKAEAEMAVKKEVWEKQAEERYKKRVGKEKRKRSKTKPKFEQHFAPGSTKGFKIIDFKQGSKNWLKWRHEGIGASNAPTIMGDNRFQTPEELLYLKKNKIDTVPNEKMLMGIKLEPEARRLYVEKTGIIVKPQCVQDNKYPWLIASMDGISDDLKHIIEIKCGQSAYWQARKGIVPEYYYGQLQHTMMITRLSQIDYWCYWPGQRSILQTVERDDEYIKILFKAEQAFQKKLES